MSKIEVDTIAPQSGTTVTVGESGDTVTIPTGVTLDASNATTTLPATVVTTTGTQTLTNKSIDSDNNTITNIVNADIKAGAAIDYSKLNLTGNIALADLSATGTKDATTFLRGDNTFAEVPAGGITEADTWQPSATTTGAYTNITSWTQQVTMGTGMSHSSGIFTFPSTGFWLITWFCTFNVNASTEYVKLRIQKTTDNSSYSAPSFIYQGIAASTTAHASGTLNYLFDVTNTSTHKMKFGSAEVQSGTLTMLSGAGTKVTFVRLGDT